MYNPLCKQHHHAIDRADEIMCHYRHVGGTVTRLVGKYICTGYDMPCIVIYKRADGKCTIKKYAKVPKCYAQAVAQAENDTNDTYEPYY